ncbi:MAG: PfkB family carbohydrate kinase [Actinomycetota bacterium]|nr:PfkB family carbohydrate kinase [Actinomycetota bacterium]
MQSSPNGGVVVFAPSPQLTVTVEELDGEPDVHLHPGGQGVWQARMVASLGVPAVLCVALGGETGHVLRHLLGSEGVEVLVRDVLGRNGAYVHDRRDGDRSSMVEMPPDALSRHELDDLYELTLLRGLQAGTVILSGPSHDRVVPASVYERLTADLTANGCRVVVDLSGERLSAACSGGPTVIKVGHTELLDDGIAKGDTVSELIEAANTLAETGAELVVVSRADKPALVRTTEGVFTVEPPSLSTVDSRGAGDSMTAAIAAALSLGAEWADAVRLGAAAGAVNVTRHGLGTGGEEAVRTLAKLVELKPVENERD